MNSAGKENGRHDHLVPANDGLLLYRNASD
jgi:hypothetical protein